MRVLALLPLVLFAAAAVAAPATEAGHALRAEPVAPNVYAVISPPRSSVSAHGHGDRWPGNAAFADLKPEIIASGAVCERIVKPTKVYDAPVAIDFGRLKAELIPSGNAHSPGDLIVWLPGEKVLVGGDVL